MTYVLALDQGTTSSRAILFDRKGQVVDSAQQEFRQIFPQPGWVEHDPAEIWSSQASVVNEVLERSRVRAGDLAAVGITNQRETTVVWDRGTGEPICNAIVWQDRRTAEVCGRLRADGAEDVFRAKTGLVLDAYFSGTKVAWILDNVPGARARAERGELAFGTIDSWLAYRLSEGALHVTDVSNASRTLLFDIHRRVWDDELLGLLNVPRAMLPDVRASSEVYGEISASVGAEGAPLTGILGDQQAAMMGQICIEPGLAKNTYGTGCFLLMNVGSEARRSKNQLLTTIAWERGETLHYALEGSVFVGGAVVQWLRDGLEIVRSAGEVEALAASVQHTDGVYFVPALAGLGAPHWDPYARGAIVGITRGTSAAHIARAALEGIAYQVADLVSAMEDDAGAPLAELRVDGGAAANDLLMQFQADLLRVPVVRPTVLETTALGAAYMAGLAVGYWESYDELAANWQVDRRFEPLMPEIEAAERRERWTEAVQRARGWERPPG
jgi:glycerol kinase